MLGTKLWGIAQLLNVLIATAIFKEMGVLMIPFAFIGGLPALAVFNIWLQYMKRKRMKNWQAIASSVLIMSAGTAACSFGLAYLFREVDTSIHLMALPSIAATLISVLLSCKAILKYLQPDEADNWINEIAVNENQ